MINPYRIIIKNGIWYRVPHHVAVLKEEIPKKIIYFDYPSRNIIKELNKDETVKNREINVFTQVSSCI